MSGSTHGGCQSGGGKSQYIYIRTVSSYFRHFLIFFIRGCLIIIWTGLNIKIGIVQKVYEWPSWYFAKMILHSGDHFGKRTAWSLIYFLNYVYFNIQPSSNNYETPSTIALTTSSWIVTNLLKSFLKSFGLDFLVEFKYLFLFKLHQVLA